MGIFEACPLCVSVCVRRGDGGGRRSEAGVCVQRCTGRRKRRADLAASRGRRYFSVRLNVGRSVSADGALTRSPTSLGSCQSWFFQVLPRVMEAGGHVKRSSADIRTSQIDSSCCLSSVSSPRSHSGEVGLFCCYAEHTGEGLERRAALAPRGAV